MKNTLKNYKSLMPAVSIALGSLISVNAEAQRCAKIEGGHQSLTVKVNVKPADIRDKSAPAWREIAKEAQRVYGNNTNVGTIQVQVVSTACVLGVCATSHVGNFPIDFAGDMSLQKTIQNFAQTDPPSAPDPSPCDPNQNWCCDECAAQFGFLNENEFFNSGYFSHNQLMEARHAMASRRIVKRFESEFDVEFA